MASEETIKAIADYLLDQETVKKKKADGTFEPISVRKALQQILNADES